MKLGLIIKFTSSGEQESFAIHKHEEWAKFATDSRSIIKDLNGFDGTGKSVVIVKMLGQLGYLIGVVKARPEGSGRPNDNTTAWIYVPAKIQISGQELYWVIERVNDQLSESIGINPVILEELFSKDYAEKKVLFSALQFINPTSDGCTGLYYYGSGTDYSLHELLGDTIAQLYYKKYKCICFVDTSSHLSPISGEIINSVPKEPIRIKTPIDNNGFKPYIKTKNKEIPFSEDIEIPAQAQLSVVWKKEGYSDITKEIKTDSNNNLAIQDNERKIILKRSWIVVINNKFKQLYNADIFINDKFVSTDFIEITEAEMREGAKIRVSCAGYESKEEVVTNISQKIEIKLDDQQFSKEYTLRAEDGKNLDSDAHIIVKMNNRYTGMPLKGYRSENGYIIYESNLFFKLKWFFLGFASVFAVGLLWTAYIALDTWIDKHDFQLAWPPITEVKKNENPPANEGSNISQAQLDSIDESIKERMCNYLNSNNVWHKDSLAQYDLTKDLYVNMNTFDLDKIIELEKTELIKNEQIKKLVNASKTSIKQKISFSETYNSDTDLEIVVDNYIKRITTVSTKVKSSTSSPKKQTSGKITGVRENEQKVNPKVEEKKSGTNRGGI